MVEFRGFFKSPPKKFCKRYGKNNKHLSCNQHSNHVDSIDNPLTIIDIVPEKNNTEQDRVVYSPINGYAYSCGANANCGNYGLIIYNDDYRISLCHMIPIPGERISGKTVSIGEPIGIMSNDGNAKDVGSHLHVKICFNRDRYSIKDNSYKQRYRGKLYYYGMATIGKELSNSAFWNTFFNGKSIESPTRTGIGNAFPIPDTFTAISLVFLAVILFFMSRG